MAKLRQNARVLIGCIWEFTQLNISDMNETILIRQIYIERFRGLELIKWDPEPGVNLILGGGDCGKTTILEALGLLFSPNNNVTLTEADYWQRDSESGFNIEATISVSDNFEFASGSKIYWPWEWNGTDPVVPQAEADEVPEAQTPVFKVAVKASADFELTWEIIQPDGSSEHFPIGLRRKVGLIKLSGDDKNDRDLRLVYGSALDRLLSNNNLRSKIGQKISQTPLLESLSDEAKEALNELDTALSRNSLPSGLDLGVSSSQGISIGALIGLFATQGEVKLPITSWGSGTRRMSALQIASTNSNGAKLALIDELERGLEPYRLRQFVQSLLTSEAQSFITTHSPIAISCSENAQLWYLDTTGSIGKLDRAKISAQQKRDPETFLSRLSIIVEGETEQGFVSAILEALLNGNPLDAGIRVCLGQGDDQMLPLLEALNASGIQFSGFADNDGGNTGRWNNLHEKMGERLFRWAEGCIESNIIDQLPDEYLENLFIDQEGDLDGYRLRTIATRLDIGGKSIKEIVEAAGVNGVSLRSLIVAAATGDTAGIEDAGKKKEWKKHARNWFKKADGSGGRELLNHLRQAGKWDEIEPTLRPFFNSVLSTSGMSDVHKIEL